mgnify:CR=1 FL=1
MASQYKNHNPINIPKPKNESKVWNPKGAGKAPLKPLSDGMYEWANAHRNKLQQPTPAQKKIFAQYDAMKKAGNNPANTKPKTKATPNPSTTVTKPKAASTTPTKPKAAAKPKPKASKKPDQARFSKGLRIKNKNPTNNPLKKWTKSLFNQEGDTKKVNGIDWVFRKGKWKRYTM